MKPKCKDHCLSLNLNLRTPQHPKVTLHWQTIRESEHESGPTYLEITLSMCRALGHTQTANRFSAYHGAETQCCLHAQHNLPPNTLMSRDTSDSRATCSMRLFSTRRRHCCDIALRQRAVSKQGYFEAKGSSKSGTCTAKASSIKREDSASQGHLREQCPDSNAANHRRGGDGGGGNSFARLYVRMSKS